MELPINISHQRPLITIQDIVNFIDKGEKYLKSDIESLTDEDEMQYLQAIILSPDYQREYRSKPKEETSIIESVILDIPIPEIFLVKSDTNGIQLRHVMDGQHRLTSIYRFVKDKFALVNLEILKDDPRYNGRKFSELAKEDKIKILTSTLSILEFDPLGDEVEIELFKRYNRNTKPLEKHEIAMATYYSDTSRYITKFLNSNFELQGVDTKAALYSKIYNITADRKKKQKNHQEICIILSILNDGPNMKYKDGVEIAEKFLEKCSKHKESIRIAELDDRFASFNSFVEKIAETVEYPFSTAIFKGEDRRNTKFHTGISIMYALINYYFDIDLNSEKLVDDVKSIILDSPLGDESYNASSTNLRSIMKYLYQKNNVFTKTYSALTLKQNVSEDIISELEES